MEGGWMQEREDGVDMYRADIIKANPRFPSVSFCLVFLIRPSLHDCSCPLTNHTLYRCRYNTYKHMKLCLFPLAISVLRKHGNVSEAQVVVVSTILGRAEKDQRAFYACPSRRTLPIAVSSLEAHLPTLLLVVIHKQLCNDRIRI